MSHTTSIATAPIKSKNAFEAWVQEARAEGLNISLEENAIPRMFYANQIAKHVVPAERDRSQDEKLGLQFHENPDECDLVLRCHDAYYDIGFIKDKNGHYVPFFDDYDYSSRSNDGGHCGIKSILGAKYAGQTEHWSGNREASDQQLHSVGKMLQGYAVHAGIEAATMQGYNVTGVETDEKGWKHVLVEVN